MRVLVTGSSGRIGRVVVELLQQLGHDVVEFDRERGQDLLDADAVTQATAGCDAVAHLGAIPTDFGVDPEEIMRVNVIGTWHALEAAARTGIETFVFMSSIQATGLCFGHRAPDYLPVDDSHPDYPSTPYMLSKQLGEQLCKSYTDYYGMRTVCLRPPAVLDEAALAHLRAAPRDPAGEREPDWNHGSWLHVDDVATAVLAALTCFGAGHEVALICAEETSSARSTAEVLSDLYPALEWRGTDLESNPFASLVDASRATAVLGWRPARRFRE